MRCAAVPYVRLCSVMRYIAAFCVIKRRFASGATSQNARDVMSMSVCLSVGFSYLKNQRQSSANLCL